MSKFHANLCDRIGSTVFMRGVWVPFDSVTIHKFFEVEDENNEDYQALYKALNYDLILKKLINGKSPWKRSILNQFQSFMRTRLTETTKFWFYFVSFKPISMKHVFQCKRTRQCSLMLL